MLKRWKFWLGAGVSAFFIILALQGLDLGQVWRDMQTAHYGWLVPGVLAYFVGVWARTWRWHYLLRSVKPISLRRLWPVVVIGYMGNNVYPFRAGEVIRAYVLKKKEGVSMSASIATILVERIFDGLVMLLFVFVALPLAPGLPGWLRQIVILASLAFFGALIVFLSIAAFGDTSRHLYRWAIGRFIPHPLQPKFLALADRFLEGLNSLTSFRDMAMIFLTSIVVWLLETVKYWLVMQAFNFSVSFFALMLMNGVVNLATTLPSAPGYIGTFDTPGIEVLKVFRVNKDTAAAYTLALHAALWLPITILGLGYMLRESLSWRDFEQAVTEARNEPAEPKPLTQLSQPQTPGSPTLPAEGKFPSLRG